MYANKSKEVYAAILGEAVAVLIAEQVPITNAALLQKLLAFLHCGGSALREKTVRNAIREMTALLALRETTPAEHLVLH